MTRVKSYDRPERKPRIIGKPPCLTEEQARYVRKYMALRAKMSRKALARKFNVSLATITNYSQCHLKRYQEHANGP